jgi:hypothetical protein
MPLPTPRRLLTLNALFARRQPPRVGAEEDAPETRMPDDAELSSLRELAGSRMARIAAEIALEEGGRRQYAPRRETQVLERR